jgi:thiamine-phosphate pyrophosphorylase
VRPLPPLYVITDGARLGEERLLERLEAAFRGGLRMVQVREKHIADDLLADLCRRIRALAPPDALIIVNRRPAVIRAAGAAGVHLGGGYASLVAARHCLPRGALVGYSAHTAGEVRHAADLGADYVSFSPVFPPRSKSSPLVAVGVAGVNAVCRSARVPVYALGGIGPEAVADLRRAGAAGVAAIGAVLDAPDPAAATRAMLEAWEAAGSGSAARRS